MKTVYVKGKKLIKLEVDRSHVLALQHEHQSMSMIMGSIAGQITYHAEDPDGSYIQSDEYIRLFARASEVLREFYDFSMGVAVLTIKNATGVDFSPNFFYFQKTEEEFDTLLYQP